MTFYPFVNSISGIEYILQIFGIQSSLLPLMLFFNLLSLSLILHTPEEDPNSSSLSSSPIEVSSIHHFLSSHGISILIYATPILLFIYYSLLLLWVGLYPSLFSCGFLIFGLVDVLFCCSSQHAYNRKEAELLLNEQGNDSKNFLNSIQSQFIVLPNIVWRQLTLWYGILVQLNSFFGSVSFCYFIRNPRFLLAFFGNHIGSLFSVDRYIQLIIIVLLYSIQRVFILFFINSSFINTSILNT